MKNVKILSSEKFDHDGKSHWRVRMEVEFNDGVKKVSHCFPDEIFMFRAAEYGFDPADIDTILDIVLTEIHAKPEPGTHLYDVMDRDVARGHHISRCAKQKLKMRLSTRPNKSVLKAKASDPNDPTTHEDVAADHPLDAIRSHLQQNPLDHRDVDHCRELIDGVFKMRWEARGHQHN